MADPRNRRFAGMLFATLRVLIALSCSVRRELSIRGRLFPVCPSLAQSIALRRSAWISDSAKEAEFWKGFLRREFASQPLRRARSHADVLRLNCEKVECPVYPPFYTCLRIYAFCNGSNPPKSGPMAIGHTDNARGSSDLISAEHRLMLF